MSEYRSEVKSWSAPKNAWVEVSLFTATTAVRVINNLQVKASTQLDMLRGIETYEKYFNTIVTAKNSHERFVLRYMKDWLSGMVVNNTLDNQL